MASVSLNFTVRDAKNAKSNITVYLPGGTSSTEIVDFAQAFALLLDAVINGAVIGISACIGVDLPSGLGTPNINSDVEEGARFIYSSAGGFNTSQRIPTFLESLLVPGTRLVDTTSPAVAALTGAMISGIAGVMPCDYREADITGLTSATESFQSSRR